MSGFKISGGHVVPARPAITRPFKLDGRHVVQSQPKTTTQLKYTVQGGHVVPTKKPENRAKTH